MTLRGEELLLDLRLTFQDLKVQHLPGETEVLWFQNQGCMPDFCPVFIFPEQLEGREPPGYTERVHDGFIAWLAQRGWRVFRFPTEGETGAVHLLVPSVVTSQTVEVAAKLAALSPEDREAVRARVDRMVRNGDLHGT